MMDISEKAGKYAEGKADEAITKAIEQAYVDGYRDGYKDREEEIPVDLRDKKTEYVDLGLPSGTLWASDYERDGDGNLLYLPYGEAVKRHLPTGEQIKELQDYCEWRYEYKQVQQSQDWYYYIYKATCIGPNGNYIAFTSHGYYEAYILTNIFLLYFWMKMEEDNSNNAFSIFNNSAYTGLFRCQSGCNRVTDLFTGYRLPIIQVR